MYVQTLDKDSAMAQQASNTQAKASNYIATSMAWIRWKKDDTCTC